MSVCHLADTHKNINTQKRDYWVKKINVFVVLVDIIKLPSISGT